MEEQKEESVIFDTFDNSSPVVLRNKTNKKIQRSKKCFSVIVEPSSNSNSSNSINNKNNSNTSHRQSMFELGNNGWIFDKFNEKGTMKNILNLDKEIEGILDENTSADVILGSIKLTF